MSKTDFLEFLELYTEVVIENYEKNKSNQITKLVDAKYKQLPADEINQIEIDNKAYVDGRKNRLKVLMEEFLNGEENI
jgi:hypothetical protein